MMPRTQLLAALVCFALFQNSALAIAPFADDVERLATSPLDAKRQRARSNTIPPLVTFVGSANGDEVAIPRRPDRSPILRSFDARLKSIDPYFANRDRVNRRSPIKW